MFSALTPSGDLLLSMQFFMHNHQKVIIISAAWDGRLCHWERMNDGCLWKMSKVIIIKKDQCGHMRKTNLEKLVADEWSTRRN